MFHIIMSNIMERLRTVLSARGSVLFCNISSLTWVEQLWLNRHVPALPWVQRHPIGTPFPSRKSGLSLQERETPYSCISKRGLSFLSNSSAVTHSIDILTGRGSAKSGTFFEARAHTFQEIYCRYQADTQAPCQCLCVCVWGMFLYLGGYQISPQCFLLVRFRSRYRHNMSQLLK